MRGFNTLWQPGTDHAASPRSSSWSACSPRGKSRHDSAVRRSSRASGSGGGETGDQILFQQRILGASPDWSRSKFTMDADLSRAVTEAFVRLFEQGLMYRATRLINWCPEWHDVTQ